MRGADRTFGAYCLVAFLYLLVDFLSKVVLQTRRGGSYIPLGGISAVV